MKILGISAYYHDSAAALIEDGKVIAAAQEERFTRLKHDASFPNQAIKYCLDCAELEVGDLDAIVFYDKPFLKFERVIQTFLDCAPHGWLQFVSAIPGWLKEKLFIKKNIKEAIEEFGEINWKTTPLLFSKHHLSHAASTFYPSNFSEAAILTIDGVGEWATASISVGKENKIQVLKELQFPNSLGLLYSAFTYFLGFKVNSGEYKLMGLAPYAVNNSALVEEYFEKLVTEVVTVHGDGSITLNTNYFAYAYSNRMIKEQEFKELFGFGKREEEGKIEEHHYCLAMALQQLTEDIVLRMAKHAKEITGLSKICLAGGVALNCVANGRLVDEGILDDVYVQPASGDAGNALGAALAAYHIHFKKERVYTSGYDQMDWSRLGPEFSPKAIERSLQKFSLNYSRYDTKELLDYVVRKLELGENIGWFQGRMEFGPRALGGRSILGNPLLKETQSRLNLKVKQRESFRPFAPVMLFEEFEKYFGIAKSSPYMLFVHKLLPEFRIPQENKSDNLIDLINQKRSKLPAITHIDYSARIQTVSKESDALMFDLLSKFKEKTGVGVLVNTSFNLRGQPIVCDPVDAIQTFLSTEIDVLVLGNYVVVREKNIALLSKHIQVKLD
jgi:carbamoyltransferase